MLSILLAVALASPPNVVFISIDTLRADHLGCYGYAFPTSPRIDAFAQQSLVFDDAVCEVPLTSPSFCAMMTSRFPRMTGAVRNGLPIPEDVPTVAEAFQQAGYETVCVTSNWTLKRDLSGLARGFDRYDDDFHKKRWGFLKSERYADEVARLSLKALESRDAAKPLFAWFHFSDPHAPYKSHSKFNPQNVKLRHLNETGKIRARYDSEIAYTDHYVGEVLAALPKENTVVVIAGDHGESLNEHDYLGHGRRIYQTCLRIPLMVSGPGIEAGRTSAPVRGMDIGPTLLPLAGIEPLPDMLGTDMLAPDLPFDRVRVVETYGGAVPNLPGVAAIMADRPPMRQGVLDEGWKLIIGGPDTELYYLPDDPMEETNLAEEQPERVERMTAQIQAWDESTARLSAEKTSLTEEDLKALESLGYIGD